MSNCHYVSRSWMISVDELKMELLRVARNTVTIQSTLATEDEGVTIHLTIIVITDPAESFG